MRSVVLAVVALGSVGLSQAVAADIVRPAPRVIAAAAPKAFNWNGAYFGLHAGYFSPSYGGVMDSAGAAFPVADLQKSGFAGGAYLGYNYQAGNWVFGLEADASWLNSAKSAVDFETDTHTASNAMLYSARARLGIAADRFLIYATGGVAYTDLKITFEPNASDITTTFGFGGVVGGGAEYALTNNLILRAEALYYIFNKSTAYSDDPIYGDLDAGDLVKLNGILSVRGGVALKF